MFDVILKYKKYSIPVAFLLLAIIGAAGWIMAMSIPSFEVDKKLASMSFQGKINYLQQTHLYYSTEMTKEELAAVWDSLFSNAVYESGGSGTRNNYDCISSVRTCLKALGSNIIFKSIPHMVREYNTMASVGYLKTRKAYQEIRHGDLIIFNPVQYDDREFWHIALVYKTQGGWVEYLDMNAQYGSGRRVVKYGDRKINMIVPVSFALWIGELMTEKTMRDNRM